LLRPREAALLLKISYPTIKQWIYHKKIKAVQTAGSHYRIPESKVDRFLTALAAATPTTGALATAMSVVGINWWGESSTSGSAA
jgi:excisionase family DNA binding protein